MASLPMHASAVEPVVWRGVALGAPGQISLLHPDRDAALAALQKALTELERLERIFSLYRPDTALVRLNREGGLDAPPLDLVLLLSTALEVAALTDGLFDPTVQPLWDLHAHHFANPGADPAGPSEQDLAAARALVRYRMVEVAEAAIRFAVPGMAVTLNGIAQGYITDRVSDQLRLSGFDATLVSLGEIRVRGRPDGDGWRIGLPDGRSLSLAAGAVASSSPEGLRFSSRCHHLFDPATGRAGRHAHPVTVLAPTATLADAASTAISLCSPEAVAHMARMMRVELV